MESGRMAPGTRVLERPDGVRVLVLRRAKLTVVKGPDAGRELDVDRPTLAVGTDPENDLVLRDETVSGRHFELSLAENGVLLRDVASKNGTFVDGFRVREIFLNKAATVEAGESELRFSVLASDVELLVSKATNFGDLLGHSAAMRAVFAILEQAAKSDATVLLLGESGTGKELAARALHARSRRAEAPYVVFDCGAASPALIESQLFGHARGAFTGAAVSRAAPFEEADGGTLVFDEIGELPLDLQPKLLRVLETRSVQRLGESKPRSFDVRFVASTNRNLEEEVRAGRFRQDLYFRLSVICVRLPPLRDRKEEIPRLLRHFVSRLAPDEPPELPAPLVALAKAYDWPGNVRELRNLAERLVTFRAADPETLLPRHAGEAARPHPTVAETELRFHDAKQRMIDDFESSYLRRMLDLYGGNISEVARVAAISRQSCYRLMKKHGLVGEESE